MDYYCIGCGAVNVDRLDSAPLTYCHQCHGTGFSSEPPKEDAGVTADESEDNYRGRFRAGL